MKSHFRKSVAVLAVGTAFAQGLGLLVLPVITRLYTPEDFGVMGSFLAILSMISVVSALRYEIAIPLAKEKQEAANLLVVSLVCVVLTSSLTILAIAFFGSMFPAQLMIHAGVILWLLPIGVLLTGAYGVFQQWATRKKLYSEIAFTRVEQAVAGIGSQLALWWAGAGSTGLIIGQIVSNGSAFFGLARRACEEDRMYIIQVRFGELLRTAYAYRRFPMYSSMESLANVAGLQLPLIIIATSAGNIELGFLMLVMRILQAPMSLVGGSVAKVYVGQATDELKEGGLKTFTLRVLKKLVILGVPPLLLAAAVAPWATPLLFGPEWSRAGELVIWMTPFCLFQFLSSPLSMAVHVVNKQGTALALQIVGLILRVFSVLVFPEVPAESFAVSSAIFYLIYLGVILMLVERSERHFLA